MDKNKIIEGAAKLVAKGAYDKAVKEYQKVLDADPKDVRVLQKMGELFQKKNDNAQAAHYFTKVAESYSTDGFFLKAVALYKQVLKLNPNLLDVNIKLAELHQQLGLMSEAMAFFQVVANAHDKAGDLKASLSILKKMVELDPDNVASRRKLAELYAKEGMNREAAVEFKRAADYYKRNNRQDDYLQVAERISGIEPDNLVLAKELAQGYLQRGDQKRALGKLQICFKADSRDVETLQLLAQAFQGLGQTSKTVSVYKELAKVYQDRGRADELTAIWAKVAALDPADPDLQARNAAAAPRPAPQPSKSAVPLHPNAAASQPAAAPARPAPAQQASSAASPIPRDQLAKLLTETDVYVKYGLHDKALEHLRRIFAVDPENLDAHEKAYQIYDSAGHHAQAADQLLNVLRLCTRRSEVARAQPYLATILQQNPGHPEVPAFLSVLSSDAAAYDAQDEGIGDDAILVDSNDDEVIVTDAPEEIIPSAGDDLGLLTATPPDADEILEDESLGDEAIAEDSFAEQSFADESFGDESFGDEPLSPDTSDDEPLSVDEPLAPEPYGDEALHGGPLVEEPITTDPEQLVAEDYAFSGKDEQVVADEPFGTEEPAYVDESASEASGFEDPALDFAAAEPSSAEIVVDDEAELDEDEIFTGEHVAPMDLAPVSEQDEGYGSYSTHANLPAEDLLAESERSEEALVPHELGEDEEVPTRASPILQSAPARPLTPAPIEVAAPISAAAEEPEDDAADEECAEAEFFLDQGVLDEARDILENVLVAYPDHPRGSSLMARLEQAERGDAAPVEEEAPREVAPIAPPQVSRLEGETDAFDLASQLADEFGTLEDEPAAAPAQGEDDFQYSVEEVFAEFKKGLEKVVKPEDVETHYDLGIAYREMGLLDDAIGEFQVAREGCKGKKKELDCLTMVGLLQLQKGDSSAAVSSFKAALASEHATGETGSAVGYELAAAYEQMGESGKALFHFQRVAQVNPKFRDAVQKAESLAELTSPEEDLPPSSQLPVAPKSAPARKVGYL